MNGSTRDFGQVILNVRDDRLKLLTNGSVVHIYQNGVHYSLQRNLTLKRQRHSVANGFSQSQVEQIVKQAVAQAMGGQKQVTNSVTQPVYTRHPYGNRGRYNRAKNKECPDCHVMFTNTMCLNTHRRYKHNVIETLSK